MTATPPPAARPSIPRWIKITLVASLAANLLVVGLMAGAALNFRRGGFQPPDRLDGPNPFLRALTRDEARQVLGALREQGRAPQDGREQTRAIFAEILGELRSGTFSADRLQAQFDALSALNAARSDLGQDAVLGYLATLDAEGRRDFADRLERALRRNGGDRRAGPPRRN